MKNHLRIDIGQRVHFRRQCAFFTHRRSHAAPVVDGLFQFGQGQIHRVILTVGRAAGGVTARHCVQNGHRAERATGEGCIKPELLKAQPDLIRYRDDE